jgi:hypothetical protein
LIQLLTSKGKNIMTKVQTVQEAQVLVTLWAQRASAQRVAIASATIAHLETIVALQEAQPAPTDRGYQDTVTILNARLAPVEQGLAAAEIVLAEAEALPPDPV